MLYQVYLPTLKYQSATYLKRHGSFTSYLHDEKKSCAVVIKLKLYIMQLLVELVSYEMWLDNPCSLSPTDAKLATCSDDGTVRTFDFVHCSEEYILRGIVQEG